jgi:uncharacterized membrane protein (DUF4010 family)
MDESFTTPSDDTLRMLLRLAISAAMGLLVGLEREFSKQVREKEEQFAGIRTYTLVSILGYAAALAADKFGPWLLVTAFFGVILLLAIFYVRITKQPGSMGGTSEITLFLVFLSSVLVFLNYILIAAAITVLVLLLLTYKPALHGFVKKLSEEDVRAIVQFTIISALVIPFLPDKKFGPYEVWSLKDIWKMVVLVSGISLVGYLLSKIFRDKGTILAGVVGGLASSTAVTLSFSKRSKENESLSVLSGVAIIAASTIMFPRILIEATVINSSLLKLMVIQAAVVTAAGFVTCYFIFKKQPRQKAKEQDDLSNPLNFSVAIKFAFIYAAIQLLVKFASEQFGTGGVYAAALISGITDVDAITISMSKMAGSNPSLSINSIWLAAFSNTVVKLVIVLAVGSVALKKIALWGFGALLLATVVVIVSNFFLLPGN